MVRRLLLYPDDRLVGRAGQPAGRHFQLAAAGRVSDRKPITGFVMAVLVLIILMGGIRRIGSFSAKLVPFMFTLYLGSLVSISPSIRTLYENIGSIFESAVNPYQMATGALVGGIVSSLRWGVFKGIQANEAGIGTQAIPHSMAETNNAESQGAFAMLSTYTAGYRLPDRLRRPDHRKLGRPRSASRHQHGRLLVPVYFAHFGLSHRSGHHPPLRFRHHARQLV